MKYVVEVTEKLVRKVVVGAGSADEAKSIVKKAHVNGDIYLEYGDYDGVDFECLREASEDDVLNYMDVEDM